MPSLKSIFIGSALAVASTNAACPGYTPIQPVFTGGIKYIMDVDDTVAHPGVWDYNTTKIFYSNSCENTTYSTHEVSFVTLDNCKGVTARWTRLPDLDRSRVEAWNDLIGPTINVTADANGTARFPCYPHFETYAHFVYELHFAGLHKSEMIANLGYYDRIISSP